MISIQAGNLGKKYGANRLFKGIDLNLSQPGAYAITGFNGSGKSTLLLALALYVTPTEGRVTWTVNGKTTHDPFRHFAFCSPALSLFEELTLDELLRYHQKFVPTFSLAQTRAQLENFGLHKAVHKQVQSFSSGMKQRLKLLMAFYNEVPVLLLDEPCTNLDQKGTELYRGLVNEKAGKTLLVVATNQPETEFPVQGEIVNLEQFK